MTTDDFPRPLGVERPLFSAEPPRDLMAEARAIAAGERRLGLLPERAHIVYLIRELDALRTVIRDLAGVPVRRCNDCGSESGHEPTCLYYEAEWQR